MKAVNLFNNLNLNTKTSYSSLLCEDLAQWLKISKKVRNSEVVIMFRVKVRHTSIPLNPATSVMKNQNLSLRLI